MYTRSPYGGYSYSPYSSYGQKQYTPSATASSGNHPSKLAQKAKQARLKGMQDGGPVDDYKPTSDRSGATGSNDYYSALGYDESSL